MANLGLRQGEARLVTRCVRESVDCRAHGPGRYEQQHDG
jgi:hypothetical protein